MLVLNNRALHCIFRILCISVTGATSRPEGVATASGDGGVAPVRNPAYEDLRRRIESFSEWPRDRTQTPRQLAEAGFFHTGIHRGFSLKGQLV